MEQIKLKRVGEEVTFYKHPNYFATRLINGKASNEKALICACGLPFTTAVHHIDSVTDDKFEIFMVDKPEELNKTMTALRKAPASDVISHLYSLDENQSEVVIPTGTITLQFKPGTSIAKRQNKLQEYGLEAVNELDFLPNGYTVRLTELSKDNPLKIAINLLKQEEVIVAEPDLSFQIRFQQQPTDPSYQDQWHLNNPGNALGLKAEADVKAEGAWLHTRGTRDITVCIMDDGFDLTHPDFSGDGKIVAPRDFDDLDTDPSPVLRNDNHGTACAGVAIAEENGIGVVGLAPNCSFMPIRISRWISDTTIRNRFQHAIDNHADVISCSWSAASWNFPLSTSMQGIIHKAATTGRRNGKGCVILFAAGNDDRPLKGVMADDQISHQGFALHPDVISVGASNSLDERSNYSNFGPQLTLCAPSSGAPGRRITTTDRQGPLGYSPNSYTHDFGGTSSATPLAAGLAALILSVEPNLSSAEVKQIMIDTADKIGGDNGNYDNNGHSQLYGHGRINAKRALDLIAGRDSAQLPLVLGMEHRINRPIQDVDTVDDILIFPIETSIAAIEINLDIRHTWRSDLTVKIISPEGTKIVLHEREGGSQDNLIRSYRSSDEPRLQRLIDEQANGQWRLEVTDSAPEDVGIIKHWGLAITYS